MVNNTMIFLIVVLSAVGGRYCKEYLLYNKWIFCVNTVIMFSVIYGFYHLLSKRYGLSQYLLSFLVGTFFLLVLSWIDLWKNKIPMVVIVIGGCIGVFFIWINPENAFFSHLISGIVLCVLGLGIHKLTRGGIGKGDVYVVGILAFFCGYKMAMTVLLFATFICGTVGIVLIVIRKANRKTKLPFIPFILVAYLLVLL